MERSKEASAKKTYIDSREMELDRAAYYEVLIRNGYFLPAFKSSFVNCLYMKAVRDNAI